MELKKITRAMMEEAVRLYVEEAYGPGPLPPAVQARLAWPAGDTMEALAETTAFDRTPADVPVAECEHLRLRLGNRSYPHMKLGADRVPDSGEWVLTVDCHDRRLLAVVQDDERAAFETLVRSNGEMKTRIERRWTDAGLPTFEQYIREKLQRR